MDFLLRCLRPVLFLFLRLQNVEIICIWNHGEGTPVVPFHMELPLIVNVIHRSPQAVRHIPFALHVVKFNPGSHGIFLLDLLHLIRL